MRSAIASAFRRWVMTKTVRPRAFSSRMALMQRGVAGVVEVGVGLVQHDQRGSP